MRKGMMMIFWAAILVVLVGAGQGSEAAALSRLALSVTPEKLVQDNLAVDSTFLISAPQEVTAEDIRQRLTLNGTRAYTLTETRDGCFRLTPETAFGVNEPVQFTLTDAAGRVCDQWAWQTTPQLLLQGMRHSDPTSHMGYDVECVELFFNLGDVDLESLREMCIRDSYHITLKIPQYIAIVPARENIACSQGLGGRC